MARASAARSTRGPFTGDFGRVVDFTADAHHWAKTFSKILNRTIDL